MQTELPVQSQTPSPAPSGAVSPASHLHVIARVPLWGVALLLGAAAFAVRAWALADFFTIDESFHWVWRVQHFASAVRQENWADTNLTGHPGVTTLWLGYLGRLLALRLGIPTEGLADGSASITYLALLRLPLALTNSLAVVVGYLLMRRLLAGPMALLGGILWAGEPFIIAHSRLLHLDALLTSFMTLTVLAVLVAQHAAQTSGREWRWLALAGVFGGLALLTKGPSLLLLPVVGLLLLLFAPHQTLLQRIAWSLPRFLFWLLLTALVFVVVWPAMWEVPHAALARVLGEITGNGAVPHHTGNYFLGQPVADPGLLFYPAVILWRSSAVLLVGLLLLPLALRTTPADTRRNLLALLLFAGLFGLALSLLPKKFDRYLLPIFPTLAILAAAGLHAGWHWLVVWLAPRRPPAAAWLAPALAPLVALYLLLTALWYHPYYLAFYNPLLGGSATAQYVLLVGWGEGMEEVGAWLQQRPDVTQSPILTGDPRTLEPFVPGRVIFLNHASVAEPASYAVLYIRNRQRQDSLPAQQQVSQAAPLYTVTRYGIPYAYIYQPPRPFDVPVDAHFGDGLHLRGYSLEQLEQTLVLTPSWNVQVDQPGGWLLFVHLLDAQGQRVAQVDVALDGGLFAAWQAGQQFGSDLPIALPPDLPAGSYQLALGVYDPATGARMPLRQGTALPASINGAEVLDLAQITIPPRP